MTLPVSSTSAARRFTVIGAVIGGTAVAVGAFGAHALETRIDAAALAVYETAARYQMYHGLALLVVGIMLRTATGPALRWAGWFFTVGVVIFSGTLYGVAVLGIRWLGAVTPLGGVSLLLGWGALAWAALTDRQDS
jgi:uncharacterized membrane protein YgdD (TMEM256/DUF423 family)